MSKRILKNVYNKTLKKCSTKPLTGYNRDGYCRPDNNDYGSHLVCAKMDKPFLEYTASKGNDLSSVVKPGDNWCLCEDRYYEAYKKGKAPIVIHNATHKNLKGNIMKAVLSKKGGTRKKRTFLYNPKDPKRSFDVYIDKDPSDTIPIKYTTTDDVRKTIKKLEKLYKSNKYSHKRIWQVGMIMKVRLEAMLKHKKKLYPNAKNVKSRFNLANKYFKFLGQRTKTEEKNRKKMVFKI
tara:strand:- start:167 stop:874 length:708 start_codon:yes stop_codon:yes gene_type:complete